MIWVRISYQNHWTFITRDGEITSEQEAKSRLLPQWLWCLPPQPSMRVGKRSHFSGPWATLFTQTHGPCLDFGCEATCCNLAAGVDTGFSLLVSLDDRHPQAALSLQCNIAIYRLLGGSPSLLGTQLVPANTAGTVGAENRACQFIVILRFHGKLFGPKYRTSKCMGPAKTHQFLLLL